MYQCVAVLIVHGTGVYGCSFVYMYPMLWFSARYDLTLTVGRFICVHVPNGMIFNKL